MTPAPQDASVSHCDAAIPAALRGADVAYVLETYATPFIETGTLVSLLSEFLPPFGGWKLCHLWRALGEDGS